VAEPTASTPPAAAPKLEVAGLSCPKCGGALAAEEGARVVACPFCQTPLLAIGEVGEFRYAVEPTVSAAQARQRTADWLRSGWNKDQGLASGAELQEPMLCFLPFFRVQADVVGYAFGTEQHTRTSGGRTETYTVDVEVPVAASCDRTYAALNVAEWGVQHVRTGGRKLLAFDEDSLQRRGMVFAPTASEVDVERAALEAFRHENDPARRLKETRFRFLATLRERTSLLYVPLWVVRYRYRARSYQALIDAADGTLAYGKAPGNDLYRAVMLVLAEAGGCLLGTTILQHADRFGEVALAGVAIFGALLWGWRRFRYGGEVEEGSGLDKTPLLPESVERLLGGGK